MKLYEKINPARISIAFGIILLAGALVFAVGTRFWVPDAPSLLAFKRIVATKGPAEAGPVYSTVVSSVPLPYTETGRITVLTRISPSTYYNGANGPTGFEYDLASAFARFLGVKANFRVLASEKEIVDAMEAGIGDIAAAGLVRTPERERRMTFGPDYGSVEPQVVCRKSGPSCRSAIGLVKHKVVVAEGSYHETLLLDLKAKYPKLEWFTVPGAETIELAGLVAAKKADFAVLDSPVANIERRIHPSVVPAFTLSEEQNLAWGVRKENGDLLAKLYVWMEKQDTKKLVVALGDKYYGHLTAIGHKDASAFHKRAGSRLPQLKIKFQRAAKDHGIEWEFLAAVAYQESLWDEDARSPEGVKGLMMITDRTAASLGVTDPYDADQSIRGGARYLARLLRDVPPGVKGRDNRMRYALVAYNIGPGHMQDARRLARRLGKDPDSWRDMKDVLPLLSLKAYHRNLPLGYARGAESVRYVGRVFSYKEILERKGMNMLPKLRLGESATLKKGRRSRRMASQPSRNEAAAAS